MLLMVLFHLTGDRRWISDPYRPVRDVRLVADTEAGFDETTAAEIRLAALDLLTSDRDLEPAVHDPGDELLHELMQWCLNERVDPLYAPMMREDLGFQSRDAGIEPGLGGRRS
ncbi:MAG: hypothetical protein R2715_01500 [Ilumatobacteraceae bacterium]